MNKKNVIIIGVVVSFAAVIIGVLVITHIMPGSSSSFFGVENNDDGSIIVTAQNADAKSSGMGYIKIEDGKKLNIRSNMTDNSSVTIEVLPENVDATTTPVMKETITSIDARQFELPAGKYTIRIEAAKGADGTMDIIAE